MAFPSCGISVFLTRGTTKPSTLTTGDGGEQSLQCRANIHQVLLWLSEEPEVSCLQRADQARCAPGAPDVQKATECLQPLLVPPADCALSILYQWDYKRMSRACSQPPPPPSELCCDPPRRWMGQKCCSSSFPFICVCRTGHLQDAALEVAAQGAAHLSWNTSSNSDPTRHHFPVLL